MYLKKIYSPKFIKVKTLIRTSSSLVLIILLLSSISTAYSNQNPPADKVEVQYIAIHFGSPDHATVMDKTEFPEFQYYCATGGAYSYSEEQKLIGNPKYLVGYYGEVPEKMGFCANYTTEKYFSPPYGYGAIYVIGQNGVISYQTPSNHFNEEYFNEVYTEVFNAIKSSVKKLKKGKLTKPLSEKKCNYLKKSAIGELETVKGSKIDKSTEGIVGWKVPEISIIDENGNNTTLKEITKNKISIVVFYTLNGVERKRGDKKGNIIDEWIGQKLISTKEYTANIEKKFMEGEYENKEEAKKEFAKTMFKAAIVGTLVGELFNSDEEMNDKKRVQAYTECVQRIKMVHDISKNIK